MALEWEDHGKLTVSERLLFVADVHGKRAVKHKRKLDKMVHMLRKIVGLLMYFVSEGGVLARSQLQYLHFRVSPFFKQDIIFCLVLYHFCP
jgi:hypothetical protein